MLIRMHLDICPLVIKHGLLAYPPFIVFFPFNPSFLLRDFPATFDYQSSYQSHPKKAQKHQVFELDCNRV